jgi:hypothetical protein
LAQVEAALAEAGRLKDRRAAAAARKGGRRVAPEGA